MKSVRVSHPCVHIPLLLAFVLSAALLFASAFFNPLVSQDLQATSSQFAFRWDRAKQGAFVTASLQDSAARIWIATEDNGVWMCDTSGKWQQFIPSNSAIGDDTFYALAEDKSGRIWAGTLRNGVSVFDGKKWQNYGLTEGLLGERIFDIAVCPTDGDVWIATSFGLTRYRTKQNDWVSFTRANGLPSDQIQSLAFDARGTLYAATQCDGLAISDAKSGYNKWRRVHGPLRPDVVPFIKNLKAPQGLPSNLINDILIARSGKVYVATTCGLAKSEDGGATWSYVRGRDWGDKVRLRWGGPPWARWQPKPGATLSEDYVTTLAEDTSGNLWVGHRRTGYEVFDLRTDQLVYSTEKDASSTRVVNPPLNADFTTSLLPLANGSMVVGYYGAGVAAPSAISTNEVVRSGEKLSSLLSARTSLPLPSPAKPLAAKEIETQLSNIRKLKSQLRVGAGLYEGEDWRTQGDWLGRYGRQYTILCAARAPLNHYIYKNSAYEVKGDIGPHRQPNDSLRHWVHWENADWNPRVLYNPITGHRREAKWDDHAEMWDMSNEGSDVWAHVTVPEGVHRISLYFYNKDGHDGPNRWRDYHVELKSDATTPAKAEKLPTMASTRVRDFWGGVYKSFVVRGPSKYWVKVGKNHSFNTILQSVMIDKIVGPQTPFDTQSLAWMGRFRYEMPDPWTPQKNILMPVALPTSKDAATSSTRSSANSAQTTQLLNKARLWEFWLDGAYGVNGGALRSQKLRLLILRSLNDPKSGTPPELLARWRWKARVWNEDDRKSWRAAMKEGHEAMLTLNPHVRGKEF